MVYYITLSNTNNEQELEKYTVAYHEFQKITEDFPERVTIFVML